MSTLPAPHPSLPAKPTFATAVLPSRPDNAPAATGATLGSRSGAKRDTREELLTPWLERLPMTQYNSTEQRLHDEIVAFMNYATPNATERTVRERLIARLTEIIQRRYWCSDVKVFGSITQDLSLLSGDIDIVINTPMVSGDENRKRGLSQLSRMLRDSGFSHNTFVVKNARVPILTFETTPELGSVKFDLSIDSTDGLKVISRVQEYLDTMPALRPLIMVTKMFLAAKGLHSAGTGGLGSYALTLMVISFLQLNPGNRPIEDHANPMAAESLGCLLMDFFDYYHDRFPYETSYISVLDQKLGSKESKCWVREKYPEALAVESIISPDLDVGRACQKIARIRTAFGEAYETLKAYRVNGVVTDPSGRERVVWHGNVLGSILGVTNSAMQHRRDLEDLLTSGALDVQLARVMLPESWSREPQWSPDRPGEGSSSFSRGDFLGRERERYRGDRREGGRYSPGSHRDSAPAYQRARLHPESRDPHYYPYYPRDSRCPR